MSQVAKKIKLDADVCMDPFDEDVLLLDVHDSILQYLNGADLLKASEVSRTWNMKVEATKAFMKKIKLSITSIPLRQGVVTRSMSKEIHLRKEDIDAILSKQRNYENVEIKLQLIKTAKHRKDILEKFAGSIVDFFVHSTDIQIHKVSNYKFPNLKVLRLGSSVSQEGMLRDLQAIMPKIETLYVEGLSFLLFNHLLRLPSLTSLKEVRFRRDAPSLLFLNNRLPHINFIQEDW